MSFVKKGENMDKSNFDTGMYIIDKNYCIINLNDTMHKMYPEVKVGDICHKALAMSDVPCSTCPLVNNDVLFYNPVRSEWISANAAEMNYPGHGECYNVQFKMRKHIGGTKSEIIRMEKVDEHIASLNHATGSESIIGVYKDEGAPIFYANENMVSLLGYDSLDEMDSAVDGYFLNAIHPADRGRVQKDSRTVKNIGETFETVFRVSHKDGTWLWCVLRGKLVETATGRLAYFSVCANMESFLSVHDELEKEKQELLKKKIQNEAIIKSIPGGYHRCANDDGYTFLYISKSFEKVVGWTKEEIRDNFDNKFFNLICPDDYDLFGGLVEGVGDEGGGSATYRIKHKDGTLHWVQDATMLIENEGESFFQCTLSDISQFVDEQEQLAVRNAELQQNEDLFKAIAKNMPSGYHRCSVDDGFNLFFISDSFLEIVGYTEEELETEVNNQYINLVAPEDREKFMALEPQLAATGRIDAVYRIVCKDGSRRWVKDATAKVTQGGQSFYQCTLADITEHVEQFQKEKERAETSSRAKSAFLFNASHDIRTPMNAIQGFTQMLKQNPDDGELVRETVEKIEKSSNILNKLLSDVLELSRIESGKVEIDMSTLDLEAYSDNMQLILEKEIREQGINFRKETKITDRFVYCDELKITQIGMNMLSNAKKFTPAGGTITMGIEQIAPEKDGYAKYRFYVKDTGIGMSKQFLARAFEQFERERTATESGVVGSGLGLSIIKKLTEIMDGYCELDSTLGEGTTIASVFNLRVTKERDAEETAEEAVEVDFAGKRILLVEDNDFNREIARFVLENMDIAVEEAEDGSEAVNALINKPAGYFDLVLMDIQMPVMDGYTATCEIRNIQNKAIADVPIVAMTANAFKEDRDKCLAVGMNEHIGKPIDADVLKKVLSEIFCK